MMAIFSSLDIGGETVKEGHLFACFRKKELINLVNKVIQIYFRFYEKNRINLCFEVTLFHLIKYQSFIVDKLHNFAFYILQKLIEI